jgi:hypothetical protein
MYSGNSERESDSHFAIKWEGANKKSNLSILKANDKSLVAKKKGKSSAGESNIPGDVSESETFAAVLAIDCRGLEPFGSVSFTTEQFNVVSDGGFLFEDDEVDLSDEWAEYDEANDAAVSVQKIECEWSRV